MFPNGNVGLENSKFYEDVPARGHLIGRAATGSCPKSTFAASPDDTTEKTIPQGQDPPGADEEEQTTQPPAERQGVIKPPPVGDEDIYTEAPNPEAGHNKDVIPAPGSPGGDPNIEPR